jgi:hypothetical protein
VLEEALDCGFRLGAVGRLHDDEVRERPHQRDVLEAHLRVAVLADPDAGMRSDELHVGAVVGDRDPDLLEAAGEEAGEARRDGDLSREGQARRHADHVPLGDADLKEPLGEAVGERLRVGRAGEVGIEYDDARILAQAGERAAEGDPRGLSHGRSPRARARPPRPSAPFRATRPSLP